jgi:hypothetical protein
MICTSVTISGRKVDVVWKPGKDGPSITEVYHHDTEQLVAGWENKRDRYAAALRRHVPDRKLKR